VGLNGKAVEFTGNSTALKIWIPTLNKKKAILIFRITWKPIPIYF
jgi:hypothetical protein